VERVATTASRFEEGLRRARNTDGWAFGLCSHRVLDAPTFDVYANTATRLRIVRAIREFPAQRAAEFEAFERPHWQARGIPPTLLGQMTPASDRPLRDADFNWPVLLVAAEPDTRNLVLLGGVASMDLILHALVARDDVGIDEALAVLILLTCHGKPADVKNETCADGSVVHHLTFSDSAFTQPFHPERFRQIRLALQTTAASTDARRVALLQLLAEHIPSVIGSLRRSPPRAGKAIHSITRSRLAESVSDALLGRSRRARRGSGVDPWWEHLDALPLRERRLYFRSLSHAEREEVKAAKTRKPSVRNANTSRVLLHRAKVKLRKVLRDGAE